ncbi:FtsX-like permease family protein [Viridibacillus sp. YIM B01967]|uniref:FtsX-like permease family protein n=1 Tax=Viridibacillus soli TaxID=2798301 RepID=A0ABS1H3E7_9BACL|nr:FtsX-like permease family protein [Viridibacillus soli]MBK3493943.1 FtsX-like permease family protein [Viridibacillus soli]
MEFIVKSVFKNMFEKKFRFFLIVLSITVSTSLFFASMAISDTLGKIYEEKLKSSVGNGDIIIANGNKAATPFFHTDKAEAYEGRTSYIIGELQGEAVYTTQDQKSVWVNLHGIDPSDMNRINPFKIDQGKESASLDDNEIILSSNTAEKYNLNIGDKFKLEVGGVKHNFVLSNTSYPIGIFADEARYFSAIIPKEKLGTIYHANDAVNVIHVKLKNPDDKEFMLNKLSQAYSEYSVREPIQQDDINNQISVMSTAFLVVMFVVSIMSIFIIYSSFKVVILERLPLIGTFRSIGATKNKANFMLISEIFLYGIIGGLIGTLLGIGILYGMSVITTPEYLKDIDNDIQISYLDVIASFVFASLLSLVSSIPSIIKLSKIPIKDIVLNTIASKPVKRTIRFVVGIILLIPVFVLPQFVTGQLAVVAVVISILLTGIALTLLIPSGSEFFVLIFYPIYKLIFGNVGMLAVKNLRQNKNMLNTISLLAIGVASLIFIISASNSVLRATTNLYTETASFDIEMSVAKADKKFVKRMEDIDGVEDIYGTFRAMNIDVVGKGSIVAIDSVDKNKLNDFWDFEFRTDGKKVLEKLDSGKNILLATQTKERLGVAEGDEISLEFPEGERTYKVLGDFPTLQFTGNYALISEKNLKKDIGTPYYSNIYVKTNKDPNQVVETLETKLKTSRPDIMTTKQLEENNVKSNDQIFTIIKGFALFSMLIGIIGVFNNLIVGIIERRKSIAMFRSIGMSKMQIVKMIFIESLTCGLIGGIIGSIGGYIFVWIIPYIFKAIYIPPISVEYPLSQVILFILATVVITISASISPIIQSLRVNIITAIKYE